MIYPQEVVEDSLVLSSLLWNRVAFLKQDLMNDFPIFELVVPSNSPDDAIDDHFGILLTSALFSVISKENVLI